MKHTYNCPNCGAPIEAEKCPYCGTVLLDFAAIQIGAPTYAKFKLGDTYITARLLVKEFDITDRPTYTEWTSTANGVELVMGQVLTGHDVEIALTAQAVMFPDDESLITVIKEATP